MNLKILTLSASTAAALMAASPMVMTSMSTDNGGTKKAIDAYSDGAGVLVINQASDTKFDNSAMNKLVFKYGDEAKSANTTLKNQVTVLSTTSTTQEKLDATTKLELGKAAITTSGVAIPVSCKAIKLATPGATNGIYTIDPDGASGTASFNAYCDMTTDGGGWTMVVAQFESNPVNNWNQGIQSNYDPTLASGNSFVFNTAQIPSHTQTGFGQGLNPTAVNYANYVYTTGNLPIALLQGIKNPNQYQIHRNSTTYYHYHDPEGGNGALEIWINTLTFDQTGGALYSWAFSPNHTTLGSKGYSINGIYLAATIDAFAWTVWVR